mmetsp:Transcript_19031/g.49755  ORF Transcript_19031/g.49755 Transcript_19031/m.49755 type:complete len:257 (-) Transcript_19031:622-1392(-)
MSGLQQRIRDARNELVLLAPDRQVAARQKCLQLRHLERLERPAARHALKVDARDVGRRLSWLGRRGAGGLAAASGGAARVVLVNDVVVVFHRVRHWLGPHCRQRRVEQLLRLLVARHPRVLLRQEVGVHRRHHRVRPAPEAESGGHARGIAPPRLFEALEVGDHLEAALPLDDAPRDGLVALGGQRARGDRKVHRPAGALPRHLPVLQLRAALRGSGARRGRCRRLRLLGSVDGRRRRSRCSRGRAPRRLVGRGPG